MRRITIFGNSGSGKSTLAKGLAAANDLAHLDLDRLAWLPAPPPRRRRLSDSTRDMDAFMAAHGAWVIEGCYSDLIEFALPWATEVVFLDLPVADCIANARARPWEPHKYTSKAAQDSNLPMLEAWITAYGIRDDTFSRSAHQALYDAFPFRKTRLTVNADPTVF
ncbi:MAG: hypothetical protein KDE22_18965 [Rhodobacterales bacterium]|nr:hypothetical protein [Rhodobacterales bacterium]